jgi:hypothetical protein
MPFDLLSRNDKQLPGFGRDLHLLENDHAGRTTEMSLPYPTIMTAVYTLELYPQLSNGAFFNFRKRRRLRA